MTESKLAFRAAVAEPHYEQNDSAGCDALWGINKCVSTTATVLIVDDLSQRGEPRAGPWCH